MQGMAQPERALAALPTPATAMPATELIPLGAWAIDPDHSGIGFAIHHLGITTLRGRFADYAGTVDVLPDGFRAEGVVQTGSIDTGNPIRDTHLLSADFLDAKAHPQLGLALDGIEREADGDVVVVGTVTIRGVERPVRLDVRSAGCAQDPYGHERVGLALRGELDRRAFGIAFDAAGALVGMTVRVLLDLSLIRRPDYLEPPTPASAA